MAAAPAIRSADGYALTGIRLLPRVMAAKPAILAGMPLSAPQVLCQWG